MYACVQKERRRNYSNEREIQIRKENISEGNKFNREEMIRTLLTEMESYWKKILKSLIDLCHKESPTKVIDKY